MLDYLHEMTTSPSTGGFHKHSRIQGRVFTYVNGAIMQREEFDSFLSELSCSIVESIFFPRLLHISNSFGSFVCVYAYLNWTIDNALKKKSRWCVVWTVQAMYAWISLIANGRNAFQAICEERSSVVHWHTFCWNNRKRYGKLVSISTARQIERCRESRKIE